MEEVIIEENRGTILSKIERVKGPLSLIGKSVSQLKDTVEKKEKTQEIINKKEKENPVITFIAVFGTIIFYPVLLFCGAYVDSNGQGMKNDSKILLIIIVTAFIIALIIYASQKNKVKKTKEKCSTEIKELTQLEYGLRKTIENNLSLIENDIVVIPPDYQYPLAVDYIYSCLRNQRANTIGEAVNLYEDQLHKWRMEQMQNQLLEISKQQQMSLDKIRRSENISAAANVATAASLMFR